MLPDDAIIILMTRFAADVLLAYRDNEVFKHDIERRIKAMRFPAEILLPRVFDKAAKELLDVWKGEEQIDH